MMLLKKIKKQIRIGVKGYFHNRGLIKPTPPLPYCTEVDPQYFTDTKVILIAVDALTWRLLTPLLKDGKLPHISQMISNGCHGALKTLCPAFSPEVWNSIATGKMPHKHGIRGFLIKDPHSGRLIPYTSNMRKCKATWEILSSYGKKVGVVGWWNTWPAEVINGAMVSGIPGYKIKDFNKLKPQGDFVDFERKAKLLKTSFDNQTYPKELFAEITPFIRSPYQIDDAHPFLKILWEQEDKLTLVEQDALKRITNAYNVDRTYVNIAKHLYQKLAPDFLTFYLAGVDVVGHKYWVYFEPQYFSGTISKEKIARYKEVIKDYYLFVDDIVGELLPYQDDKTVVAIISDHGMSPSDKKYRDTGVNSAVHLVEDGAIIISGSFIKKGYALQKKASVIDLLPTFLAMMGFPVGADMDGGVIEEIFAEDFLKKHPVRYIDTHDRGKSFDETPIPSPVDGEIKQHLRSLGYIE